MKLNMALLGRLMISTLSIILPLSLGFYLPGVAPTDYSYGQEVALKVNKLTSSRTQLSYDYYKLPFCRPDKVVEARENLGEILAGNMIQNSPYKIEFLVPKTCEILCRKLYPFFQVNKFVSKIKEYYIVNFIVDNLPSALRVPQSQDSYQEVEYFQGFPVGGTMVDQETGEIVQHFLNNHHRIIIKYHMHERSWTQNDVEHEGGEFDDDKYSARIVGVDVEPFSVKHLYDGAWDDNKLPILKTCPGTEHVLTKDYVQALDGFTAEELEKTTANDKNKKKRLKSKMKETTEVIWTYDVVWEASEIKWATRWDVYLNANAKQNDEVHWFAIVNSLLIVVFLTGMVAMILLRTLHRDLTRYNKVPTEEEKAEDREETGWKLVHGDVFRPPSNRMLFSVIVGTGSQVLAMSAVVLVVASVGFLSPANRGSLMLGVLLLFVLMGSVNGYNAARTYKAFHGTEWQRCTILTATLFPGLIFAVLFFMDLIVWAEGSSNAVPFLSIISVLLLWFGISVPLTFLGAFYGFKKDADVPPVKTQQIARAIPEQPWYMNPILTILMGGILPFGAVFVELFFILSSMWLEQYYYVFGFLFLVFLILVVTCAEISIVLCYFQLCGEDYMWQWRALLTSGSSAAYLFFYSIVYFGSRLQIDMIVSAILYFCYMGILSLLFFLMTSVIGYFACRWFVFKIYAAVKVD